LTTQRASKSRFPQKDNRLEAAEHLLLPPYPLAGLEKAKEEEIAASPADKSSLEVWAEEVAEACGKAQASRKPAPLSIDTTNIPPASVSNPPSSTSPSKLTFPERPTAPEPMSPPDSDDDEGAAVFKRPSAPEPGAMSSVTSLGASTSRGSVAEGSLRISIPAKTLESQLTSFKSKSTANLFTDGFGYVDGAPLARSRKSSVSSISSTKRRMPVVKKLLSIGKRKASSGSMGDRKPKGQKRQRGEREDENVAIEQGKGERIIVGQKLAES
ncbi:hypothetical protein MPER_02668, partial [Moniliophthora perniciosa FA553]